jgi:hypothetical protein
MSDPFIEMAEFAGRACGTIAKDLAEVSVPLAEAFRRGWQEAMTRQATTAPAPAPPSSEQASESV